MQLCISKTDTLKSIYFVYYNSVIKYEIIFWCNWTNSKNIFTLQTKILESWWVSTLEICIEACLRDQRSYLFHVTAYFH
jgi:hypothetical protein